MTKAQEKKIERLRSDAAMQIYDMLLERNMLSGDVIHCGGLLSVDVKGIGRMKIQIRAELEGPPPQMVIRRVQ